MKKISFIIFCSVLLSNLVFAQIEKGSTMMGFNLNGTYTQNKNNTGFKTFTYASSFNINPNVGFFVRKNSCVGFSTGYYFNKGFANRYDINSPSLGVYDTSYSESKEITNSFGLDLFYRKYWFLNDKFSLAANISTGFSYGLVKDIYHTDNYNAVAYSYNLGFNIGLSPTMIFFPHEQYGIELSYGNIGYNYLANIQNKKNLSEQDGFRFNFGPSSLRLGFHYYMFKKSSSTNK